MIVARYLTKEIIAALCGITGLLVLAFLSNQFVRYLASAATGKLPGIYIIKLMLLVIPQLVGLLLPLGLFFSILLTLGRFYSDQEMTVLRACGFTDLQLVRIVLSVALIVAIFVGAFTLWVSPYVSVDRQRLLRQGGSEIIFYALLPGHFQKIGNGDRVIYVQDISRDHQTLDHIFAARKVKKNPTQWDVVTAEKGHLDEDTKTHQPYFVIENGSLYQGTPGQQDYKVTHFKQFALHLTQEAPNLSENVKTLPTRTLWNNPDPEHKAELQWRISAPIMTLILALLAIPLSRLRPRQGKYAKILPASIFVIAYANMLIVLRDWIGNSMIPVGLGMWWMHALMLLIALWLFRKKI